MVVFRAAVLALACLSGAAFAASSASAPASAAAESGVVDLWQLFQEARGADPRILSAQAKSRSGAWSQREAFGKMLPQLASTNSFNRTHSETQYRMPSRLSPEASYDGARYSIGLSQVLYSPEIWQNYRRFSALAQQQEAEAESVLEQASVDLVERYFIALAAEDERDLVAAELRATQGNQRRVESLFKRQMAMVTDVLEITARVDALKSTEIEAGNQVVVSREALSELIGRPLSEQLRRIGQRPSFIMPEHDREYWVRTALEANPALLARKHAVDVAEAAVRQANAGHLPTVNLNLIAQRSDIGYENSQNPRTDSYVASVGVQVPLYSGGSTSARVASMHEQLMASEQDFESARRQVVRQTREAYHSAEAGLSRIGAARTAQASAEKSRQAAERAFELGAMNAVDVLNTVKDEYRARRDLLKAQYDFIMSVLVLRRWSGTLVDEDIRKANEWLVANAGE